jgi:hypothetical protein
MWGIRGLRGHPGVQGIQGRPGVQGESGHCEIKCETLRTNNFRVLRYADDLDKNKQK